MQQSPLRPIPGCHPGSSGAVSRCDTGVNKSILLAVFLSLLPSLLLATPLQRWLEPGPLAPAAQEHLVFFDPRPETCAQDAGCLIEMPHYTLPVVLAAPLRRQLPAVAARTLLPVRNRWLLAVSSSQLRPGAIVPSPPQVGQKPRGESLPFDLVARADRLHVAGLFLIGTVLMLLGAALGLIVQRPSEPAVPRAEPWIPERKLVPRLVTSPVSAAHLKSQPL